MLDDRYRIDSLISVGGMGAVYAGHHTLLQKPVAIKVLRSDLPGSELMVDRFHREAIAASAIGHENIVQVTDMGITREGMPYLVMELLQGHNLGDAIRTSAPLEVERSCRIICEILRGLGAAHQAGIVHRDLKPDNVFLVKKGEREVVKLLDFGVALLKRPDIPDTRLTFTGTVLGTPRYMSPEQARGEQDLTGLADIYAAGVLLYEMLTGALPYVGTNYNVVIHEIIGGDRVPLESRRSDVPPEVSAVVHRAMAIAPEDRFASAEEMEMLLLPFAGVRWEGSGQIPLSPGRARNTDRPPMRRKVPTAPDDSMSREPAWAGASSPRSLPVGSPSGQFAEERERARAAGGGRTFAFVITLVVAGAVAGLILLSRTGASKPALDAGPTVKAETPAAAPPPNPPARKPEPEPEPEPVPTAGVAGEPGRDGTQAAEPVKPVDPPKPPAAVPPKDGGKSEPKKPAADGKVSIEFLIVPPSARVTIDGKPLRGKRMEVKRGKKGMKVRIEASGYEAQTLTVVPNEDREVLVQLLREPEEEPAPPPDPQPDPPPKEEPENPAPSDG